MKVDLATDLFGESPDDEKIKKQIRKDHGQQVAKIFLRRLRDARAASCLREVLKPGFPGKWEILDGDRAGQISARLDGGKRLICTPSHSPLADFIDEDGNFDPDLVKEIVIREITNYH